MFDFAAWYDRGLTYDSFLAKFATEEQKRRWSDLHAKVSLTAEQKSLLQSFKREMKVLVVAGAWCGDCVNQCPIFPHFVAENDRIGIRYFDRDESAELAAIIRVIEEDYETWRQLCEQMPERPASLSPLALGAGEELAPATMAGVEAFSIDA